MFALLYHVKTKWLAHQASLSSTHPVSVQASFIVNNFYKLHLCIALFNCSCRKPIELLMETTALKILGRRKICKMIRCLNFIC